MSADDVLVEPAVERIEALHGRPEPMRILAGAHRHPARSLLEVGFEVGRIVLSKWRSALLTRLSASVNAPLSSGLPRSAACAGSVASDSQSRTACLPCRNARPITLSAALARAIHHGCTFVGTYSGSSDDCGGPSRRRLSDRVALPRVQR